MRIGLAAMAMMVAAPLAAQAPAPKSGPDRNILHVQVILDSLGFAPGVLDGKGGQSLVAALKGFQESRGLPKTGKPDAPTLRAMYQYRAKRPTVTVTLTPQILAGPYVRITKDYGEQAKLPTLGYRSPMEKLAEMFHTTPAVLVALNSRDTRLSPGTRIVVPNALPGSRTYPADLNAGWRATLAMLNVDANSPKGDHIVVDKSDGVLRVYDKANKLVGQFSVTTGSGHDPLPLGEWKIYGADYNPKFHYNPDLFWDAKKGDEKAMLPAGPNAPVGVIWMDLSKEHYGIHGTPEPQTIGRTASHGCIRMTNWDAARLSLMVPKGSKAVFQA